MRLRSIVSVAACFGAMNSACGAQVGSRPQTDTFKVELRALNDDGAPLAGAIWTTNGSALGETGIDGVLRLNLRGREGQSMRTALSCPEGYVAPDAVPEIRLAHARRISDKGAQPVMIEVVCSRTARDIVLVMHAEHAPFLPLLVDGKLAGSTDADGNAHVLLRVDRSVHKVDVAIDTSARPDLTPKSPARSFELDGRDGVLVFAESFTRTLGAKAKTQGRTKYIPYRVN